MNIDQQRAAFEAWVAQFDTYSDEYQDMGADQYFIAGYQAALASPEVRALRKDAERWDLFRAHWKTANIRNDPKTGNFKSATVTLSPDRGRFQAPLDDMADTILAAMEKQK